MPNPFLHPINKPSANHQELLRFQVRSRFYPVEVHTARQPAPVELHLMIPPILFSILQNCNLLSEVLKTVREGTARSSCGYLPPSHGCKQSQNACQITAKSWSSTSGIHYHRVLDCFPSTVKFANEGACESLFVNE